MGDQSNAYRALALVLDYGDHGTAAREPFGKCTENHEDPHGCYHEWRHAPEDHGWGTGPQGLPTPDAVEQWCDVCQENNAISERRTTARKRRGATLRSMTALAKRVREDS